MLWRVYKKESRGCCHFLLSCSHVQIEGVDPDDKSATLEKLESASRCDHHNSPFTSLSKGRRSLSFGFEKFIVCHPHCNY